MVKEANEMSGSRLQLDPGVLGEIASSIAAMGETTASVSQVVSLAEHAATLRQHGHATAYESNVTISVYRRARSVSVVVYKLGDAGNSRAVEIQIKPDLVDGAKTATVVA